MAWRGQVENAAEQVTRPATPSPLSWADSASSAVAPLAETTRAVRRYRQSGRRGRPATAWAEDPRRQSGSPGGSLSRCEIALAADQRQRCTLRLEAHADEGCARLSVLRPCAKPVTTVATGVAYDPQRRWVGDTLSGIGGVLPKSRDALSALPRLAAWLDNAGIEHTVPRASTADEELSWQEFRRWLCPPGVAGSGQVLSLQRAAPQPTSPLKQRRSGSAAASARPRVAACAPPVTRTTRRASVGPSTGRAAPRPVTPKPRVKPSPKAGGRRASRPSNRALASKVFAAAEVPQRPPKERVVLGPFDLHVPLGSTVQVVRSDSPVHDLIVRSVHSGSPPPAPYAALTPPPPPPSSPPGHGSASCRSPGGDSAAREEERSPVGLGPARASATRAEQEVLCGASPRGGAAPRHQHSPSPLPTKTNAPRMLRDFGAQREHAMCGDTSLWVPSPRSSLVTV
eukprot:TRINITY_DN1706_c0_g3_i1.p1 TRINITY_DN1706_c0_g3~~TRINITY_DN1706_c0_g3_i1.p1  ORF type:complete len:456 (+),score=132.74 TRINITY_DN1706_c0_g3_i1:52-1419(+)